MLLGAAQVGDGQRLGLVEAALTEPDEPAQPEHPRPSVRVTECGEARLGLVEPRVGTVDIAADERGPGPVLVHPGEPTCVAAGDVQLLRFGERSVGIGEPAGEDVDETARAQREGEPGVVPDGPESGDRRRQRNLGLGRPAGLIFQDAEQPVRLGEHASRRRGVRVEHRLKVGARAVEVAQPDAGLGKIEQQRVHDRAMGGAGVRWRLVALADERQRVDGDAFGGGESLAGDGARRGDRCPRKRPGRGIGRNVLHRAELGHDRRRLQPMVSEHIGHLATGRLAPLDRRRDTGVALGPRCFREHLVGDVAHRRRPEPPRGAVDLEQLGGGQGVEHRAARLLTPFVAEPFEHRPAARHAEHGGVVEHLAFARRERVEAGGDHAPQRVRQSGPGRRHGAGLGHQAGELLDEQRVPAAAQQDVTAQFVVGAADEQPDEPIGVVVGQGVES